ncbi:hypothetical protein HPP92_028941 [Vanilla planifolia]|uniref:Uncharacterized protein n=1 Tax=Vanilla planifolia TaxID=51239 RepID=A0A835P6M3_VANPL|nr:hypothetical protein HPP92_028931 [Vanilla planifolia]KAG0446238.1 hypothetical protein HPP92_028941 [Vanilla planifolia]
MSCWPDCKLRPSLVVSRKGTIQKETDGSFYSSESSAARLIRYRLLYFAGYPNVGKRALTNALRVESTGVTFTPERLKHFPGLSTVSNELILCDRSGFSVSFFSRLQTPHDCFRCAAIVDRMTDHREVVQIVANSVPRNVLEEIYNTETASQLHE